MHVGVELGLGLPMHRPKVHSQIGHMKARSQNGPRLIDQKSVCLNSKLTSNQEQTVYV